MVEEIYHHLLEGTGLVVMQDELLRDVFEAYGLCQLEFLNK